MSIHPSIPLCNIKALRIADALVKFFTLVGLPSLIQSDQGSNFMSSLMQQVTHQLGIKQCKSSAYHPETQGALERFHQTLKLMIRTYCLQYEKQWDQGIHLLLFAVREVVQESLGFSPFELVFGRTVRGPLKLLKEGWLTEEPSYQPVGSCLSSPYQTGSRWRTGSEESEACAGKVWYDRKSKLHKFSVGDKVLVLLLLQNHTLQARYCGPYLVTKKVNDVDYVISTPDRQKTLRLCHVNTLKPYKEKVLVPDQGVHPMLTVALETPISREEVPPENDMPGECGKLKNSSILANLESKVQHLSASRQAQLSSLLNEFVDVFPDVPKQTTAMLHDMEVGDASPIKQHPYHINPLKLEVMKKEVEYMLVNGIIEPSKSQWSSPCILVPKGDGSNRFCTDFRKVNTITKTDSYPIPRVEDCIDKIGRAEYVSKFDLLKGYWQVPLTPRAKEITAFVTPTGFYQYRVMPFGLKNAPATFQQMIHQILAGLEGCEGYIDDIIIFSDTWDQHMERMKQFLTRLRQAQLTVNLAKSEFGQACITYLGHVVGKGGVKSIHAKVDAILNFPTPKSKSQLMRFLGMVGFYQKFCKNFAVVAEPLTRLLQKKHSFTRRSTKLHGVIS